MKALPKWTGRRKPLFVAPIATTVMVVALVFGGFVGEAGASTINATDYSIACIDVTGTVQFAPALVPGGSSPESVTVDATVKSCTVTPINGGAAIHVTAGTVRDTLTFPANNCATLLSGQIPTALGNLSAKWKSHPALTQRVTSGHFATMTETTTEAGNIGFSLANPTDVEGPFEGTNFGATAVVEATSKASVSQLSASCSVGLKKLTLSGGSATLN
jgi:hypothetical protein